MAVLPDYTTLLSLVRVIQNGEPVSTAITNRPMLDLLAALAGNNGIFGQVEDLIAYSAIHKASHVTNDTKLLVHFDDSLDSAIDTTVPSSIPSGLVSNIVDSKFFGCYDMDGASGPIVYSDLETSQTGAGDPISGTISVWVRPSQDIWDGPGDFVFLNTAASGAGADTIEIGFNSTQKYFYANFEGSAGTVPSTTMTIILTQSDSYADPATVVDKWFNLVITFDLTGATDDCELNFYVNGVLEATNLPVGDPLRFNGVIDFTTVSSLVINEGNYLVDELRYDQVLVTDEEVFAWYHSDVPFVHRVDTIKPGEFGHVNIQQLMKTVLSGAASGDFVKNYIYFPDDASHPGDPTVSLANFLAKIDFIATSGQPSWTASATFGYDLDGYLALTEFRIEPNGNGNNTYVCREYYRYDTSIYDSIVNDMAYRAVGTGAGDEDPINAPAMAPDYPTTSTLRMATPSQLGTAVHSGTTGFLQDTLVVTSII